MIQGVRRIEADAGAGINLEQNKPQASVGVVHDHGLVSKRVFMRYERGRTCTGMSFHLPTIPL